MSAAVCAGAQLRMFKKVVKYVLKLNKQSQHKYSCLGFSRLSLYDYLSDATVYERIFKMKEKKKLI